MLKENLKIFKAYDIRGIYPQEINEKITNLIGKAFVKYTGAKKVIVGRDMRLSSPQLSEALIKGITEESVDVLNIGLIPTECLYFTLGHYDYETGIMCTASHNPKEYNGLKMMKRGEGRILPVRGKEIGEMIEKEIFPEALLSSKREQGKIQEKDIWQDYLKHIFSFVALKKIKPFKVVIDTGNGMAGKVIPQLQEKLPVKIIPLNFELDGSFPAHPSNPLLEESTRQISEKIRIEKADFGFIFDGDADRIFLIDEKGNFVRADTTLLLLAKYFLEKNPGKAIIYNLICSKAVLEFIEKWGGKPIRSPVGYVNTWDNMKKHEAIMGGELSGHYAFRDNFYTDSAFISFLVLLEIISQTNKKVSEIIKELNPYAKAPEINLEIEDKETVLNMIKKKYSTGHQDFLDGITVEYDDWWFNVRLSHTEPLLRLTIEAKTKELLEEKKKELTSLINPKP